MIPPLPKQGVLRLQYFLSLFSSLVAVCFTATADDGALKAGAARIDITPTAPVMLGGYASRKHPSTGIHDPLGARAVSFANGDNRLVLVSLDLIGFYNNSAEPLRQAILDATGLKSGELFLAAIHDHSSPILSFDPAKGFTNNIDYSLNLRTQLVQLVRDSLDHSVPVTLHAGSGSSPVGVNRRQLTRDATGNPRIELGRNPDAWIDRETQVLRIARADDNNLLAILFDHGVHSTSLGPQNFLVSGDVHGLAEQFVERYFSSGHAIVAPGFAGASGDIDPWIRVLPDFRETNGWTPEPVLLGTMLGEEVARVAETMNTNDLAGPISSLWKILELPGKPEGQLRATNNWPATRVNITVAHIGQVAFVGFGGEMFNEIGSAIKKASPFPVTIVITHCNGAAGYLPTRRAYLEGGYEVQSSPFAPDAADIVVRESVRLLHQL